jgi:DNA modification methylase
LDGENALAAAEMHDAVRRASERLTAKRLGGDRGIDRWYPYYAGYSYSFAAEILRGLCRQSGSTVLDPWNGSGTTTAAAAHLGHKAVGFDLNPAMVAVANSKLLTASELASLPSDLHDCLTRVDGAGVVSYQGRSDPLLAWLPPSAVRFARSVLSKILAQGKADSVLELSPRQMALVLVLMEALRQHAVDGQSSNATWARPAAATRPSVRISNIRTRMIQFALSLLEDQSVLPSQRLWAPRLQVADCRRVPLADSSVDVVFSSPPYCTRIDYAKKTRFELALLFSMQPSEFRVLRDGLMGTTTIRSTNTVRELPDSIQSLLRAIGEHPSHRSHGYYMRNARQYFADASLALAEVTRVLRPGGTAALVLQNSYYKEIPIELSHLYCEMGAAHGLSARIAARKPVGRTMASLNSKSKRYRIDRQYSEDVVIMEKR